MAKYAFEDRRLHRITPEKQESMLRSANEYAILLETYKNDSEEFKKQLALRNSRLLTELHNRFAEIDTQHENS